MEKLPKRLLDKSVEYHCRKGFRDCNCKFCETKWRVTVKIANASWIPWYLRESYRISLRNELRIKLDELKQQII